jgi:hypothetical protein
MRLVVLGEGLYGVEEAGGVRRGWVKLRETGGAGGLFVGIEKLAGLRISSTDK